MVIGLLRVQLHIPMCHSLKEKRSVLKRVIHRLRVNNNCAVAETGLHEHWQSAELSMVTVYSEKSAVESLLTRLENMLDEEEDFEVAARELEFL